MTELLLYMNNYSITGAITAYQTYPKSKIIVRTCLDIRVKLQLQTILQHFYKILMWSTS